MIVLKLFFHTLVACSWIRVVSLYVILRNDRNRITYPLECKNQEQNDRISLTSPYLTALMEEGTKKIRKFFFPSHSGGKYLPKSFRKLEQDHIFNYDMPELDGLDNIHSPEVIDCAGPLLKALEQAAKVFGAARSWFLVNGSTSGIHSAILLCVKLHQMKNLNKSQSKASIFLLGRDSHKSAFDGLNLALDCDALLLPCEVVKDFDVSLGIYYEDIVEAITTYDSNICGLLLTRPTYQGVLLKSSEVIKIIELCHHHQIPVIIDEAHGSHLKFLELTDYQDGLTCGADIVVQSTHKTLFALSQCAMMHINHNAFKFMSKEGKKHDRDLRIEEISHFVDPSSLLQDVFSSLTTTSPNSLFLASLDASTTYIASHEGKISMKQTILHADHIKNSIRTKNKESTCRLLNDHPRLVERGLIVDPLRLSLRFDGQDSLQVDDDMCRDDGIYCELNLKSCITYNLPIGLAKEEFDYLFDSLIRHSSNTLKLQDKKLGYPSDPSNHLSFDKKLVRSKISLAKISNLKYITWLNQPLLEENRMERNLDTNPYNRELIHKISYETICPYPPGIPVIFKGEEFTNEILEQLVILRNSLSKRDVDDDGNSNGNKDDSVLGSGCTVTGCLDPSLTYIRIANYRI